MRTYVSWAGCLVVVLMVVNFAFDLALKLAAAAATLWVSWSLLVPRLKSGEAGQALPLEVILEVAAVVVVAAFVLTHRFKLITIDIKLSN